jgi:thiol-disulfide isomerase/thioredoxin
MKIFTTSLSILSQVLLLLVALFLFCLASSAPAVDVPVLTKEYQSTNDEFSGVGKAVVELLQTRDTARFADAVAPSIEDWNAILSTNLAKSFRNLTRQEVESSARALLAQATALHLDFSTGDMRPRIISPKRFGTIHYSQTQGKDLPRTEKIEIILNPGFATNSPVNGSFKIAVEGMTKFPGGWRSTQGCRWESFPANVADEKTRRELALINKAVANEGFTGQDDPALLKLGETLVYFIRNRDISIYEKNALVNSDFVWAIFQKRGGSGATRQEIDQEVNSRVEPQLKIARSVIKEMDDEGIDLKNADIHIKEASIKHAQSPGTRGSLDGSVGDQFRLTLAVKTSGKAKSGASLSGDYILAANELMRFGGEWKIMDNVHWYQFPEGVADKKTAAAIQFENYVGEYRTLPQHTAAPDIAFTALAGEKKMQLSDLRGKVVVLDFWATWCGPCQEPMAKLQTLRQEHPDWKDRVAIVPLSIDDTIGTVRNHVDSRGWTNTLNVWAGDGGWNSKPATTFRVTGVPTTYIIDSQGRIVRAGHPAAMDIGREVEVLLAQEKPGT